MLTIRRRLKPGDVAVRPVGRNGEPSMNLPSQNSPILDEKKVGSCSPMRKPNDNFPSLSWLPWCSKRLA